VAQFQKKAQADLARLTDQYETRISKLSSREEELNEELSRLSAVESEKRQLEEQNVDLNNRFVFIQRRMEDMGSRHAEELNRLQERVLSLRADLSTVAEERDSLKSESADLTSRLQRTSRELTETQEQLEALRNLWKDQSRELEKLSGQNDALTRLNRDLSVQINTLRRNLEAVQTD
jgi:chromosome segregation ATPase